jgi:phage gp36-like protein
MSFASVSDLLLRVPAAELAQLTDRSPPPRVVTEALLTAGIAGNFAGMTGAQQAAVNACIARLQDGLDEATQIAQGYVMPVYPGVISMSPVPTILVRMCCDIARANLYASNMPELVQRRFDTSMQTLRDISRGIVTLGETASVSEVISSSDLVEFDSAPVHMTRHRGRDFI